MILLNWKIFKATGIQTYYIEQQRAASTEDAQ